MQAHEVLKRNKRLISRQASENFNLDYRVMIVNRLHIAILSTVFLVFFTEINAEETQIQALTTQTAYEIGNRIVLRFSTTKKVNPYLYCTTSYGTTLISPNYSNNKLYYMIPLHISKKIGVVNWKLIHDESPLSGQFKINPKQEITSIETYLAPLSIMAGKTDYAELVVIPTDSFNNPMLDKTNVEVKYQFSDTLKRDTISIQNFIAHKKLYAPNKTGRMLVSSECLNTNSKEYVVDVLAAIPTHFSIQANRPHVYADGNQITTFSTSIITDKDNNIVSDGTLVKFAIKNKMGHILHTSGTTIKGVATAKICHPLCYCLLGGLSKDVE